MSNNLSLLPHSSEPGNNLAVSGSASVKNGVSNENLLVNHSSESSTHSSASRSIFGTGGGFALASQALSLSPTNAAFVPTKLLTPVNNSVGVPSFGTAHAVSAVSTGMTNPQVHESSQMTASLDVYCQDVFTPLFRPIQVAPTGTALATMGGYTMPALEDTFVVTGFSMYCLPCEKYYGCRKYVITCPLSLNRHFDNHTQVHPV